VSYACWIMGKSNNLPLVGWLRAIECSGEMSIHDICTLYRAVRRHSGVSKTCVQIYLFCGYLPPTQAHTRTLHEIRVG